MGGKQELKYDLIVEHQNIETKIIVSTEVSGCPPTPLFVLCKYKMRQKKYTSYYHLNSESQLRVSEHPFNSLNPELRWSQEEKHDITYILNASEIKT